MKPLELAGEVDEQRQLHATLPADVPAGPVRVLVSWPESANGANGAVTQPASLESSSDAPGQSRTPSDEDWDSMMQLIEECQMNTGIGDLAHQHDHYLYGKPKRSE